VATREAFGATLVKLGEANPRVVVLDADVKNSTFTDRFAKKFPERFFEIFIAEQNMIGILGRTGQPGQDSVCSHLRLFFDPGLRLHRMAAISRANIKLMGSMWGIHRRRRAVADGLEIWHDGRAAGRRGALSSDAVCTIG